jgi:phytoene synthase
MAGDTLAAGATLMARKTSFYYSFLVLPSEQRRAIIAVWDFCRAVDDAVDEPPAEGDRARPTGRDAVRFWRQELARAYEGGEPETAEGRRLQPVIRQFDLPRQAFEDVIDGCEMDLERTSYSTFADLYEYCRRVASAVGLICIRVFGCSDEGARDYAMNLGLALQLTNILRDVKDDLARGRVYLPADDLAAFGCGVDDLRQPSPSRAVRELIAFECRRARSFYERAVLALPDADRRRLVAAEIMRAVYFETLRRIERCNYDVLTSRVRVARPRQALIAVRQLLWR